MSERQQAPDEKLSLAPAEYRLIVAPALAAAAETAAERGDPNLFNDMASMLALSWMVEGLAAAYQRDIDPGQWQSPAEAMEAAPLGACALVFTESELDESAVQECLAALGQAGRLLVADGVDRAGREELAGAWSALKEEAHEEAILQLRHCARRLCQAVDAWESSRGGH